MLKIKDNIELSELEKFGFELHKTHTYYLGNFPYGTSIYIDYKRRIEFDDEWWGEDFDLIDILYDLIKADMVEKVESGNG